MDGRLAAARHPQQCEPRARAPLVGGSLPASPSLPSTWLAGLTAQSVGIYDLKKKKFPRLLFFFIPACTYDVQYFKAY